MSSKVVLEKRRPDTVISECRVRRRDASEKRGLAGLRQSPWGERASGWADKLVRRDRHGFPPARTFHTMVLPAERHAPIIGGDQPAGREGKGDHLAWRADRLCSLLERGRRQVKRVGHVSALMSPLHSHENAQRD